MGCFGKGVATKLPFRNELYQEKGSPSQRSSMFYQMGLTGEEKLPLRGAPLKEIKRVIMDRVMVGCRTKL